MNPKLPRAVVYVSGGVVQDVEVPPGFEVEVRDYDVDHVDANFSVDDAGVPYWSGVYGGQSAPVQEVVARPVTREGQA